MKLTDIWIDTYYTIFRFEIYTQKIFSNVVYFIMDPLDKLIRRSNVSRRAVIEERVRPIFSELNERGADLWIGGLSFSLMIAIINFLSCVIHCDILARLDLTGFLIIGLLSIPFDYIVLWRNDKYKDEFAYRDTLNNTDKKRVYARGVVVIILILITCIFSFYMLSHCFHENAENI